jgi:hypothetical protein
MGVDRPARPGGLRDDPAPAAIARPFLDHWWCFAVHGGTEHAGSRPVMFIGFVRMWAAVWGAEKKGGMS